MGTAAVILLGVWLLVRRIGQAIDRSDADATLRNGVALIVELVDDPDIGANLDV